MKKKNESTSQSKSVPPSRRPLKFEDTEKAFEVALKDALEILPGMVLQFFGPLTEEEVFALTWDQWNGQHLTVVCPTDRTERIIEPNSFVINCLDVLKPHAQNAKIIPVSRAYYQQVLQYIWKRASIPDPGVDGFYKAGVRFGPGPVCVANRIIQKAVNQKKPKKKPKMKSKTQARPPVRPSNITIPDLANEFGKARIDPSYSCDDSPLRYPPGYKRQAARVLWELVRFAGNKPVHYLSIASAFNFLGCLQQTRNGGGREPLAWSTVRKMGAIASSMFAYGMRRGSCQENPFRGLLSPTGGSHLGKGYFY